MKQFFALAILSLITLFTASTARAVSDPPLFSCLQPIGTLTTSYSSGTHGIPGDPRTYTGSDRVYSIDQIHVLQCFCPSDSDNGIQSNWWRVDDLTQDEIDFFVRRGWVYIPNGQPWGLASAPYLVKNDSFSCDEPGRGGNGGQSNGSSSSSNPGSSSDSVGRGGAVLGADSLASTGNSQKIALLYVVGTLSALLAYRLGRG